MEEEKYQVSGFLNLGSLLPVSVNLGNGFHVSVLREEERDVCVQGSRARTRTHSLREARRNTLAKHSAAAHEGLHWLRARDQFDDFKAAGFRVYLKLQERPADKFHIHSNFVAKTL